MAVEDGSTSIKASAPFDDSAADVVLRTCDGVDFYVYKIILSLSSPFFKSMFSLKQPADPTDSPTSPYGQPIVDVQETSQILDHLLRLCYPIPDPAIQDIKDIGDVLEAAMKYEMEQPTTLMKKQLRSGPNQPLEVFAIACRLHMEGEAAAAAAMWSRTMPLIPVHPQGKMSLVDWNRTRAGQTYVELMSHISAGAYFRLLRFVHGYDVGKFCDPPASADHPQATLPSVAPTVLPDFNSQGADIVIRSSDDVDFPVHKAIISFATNLLSAEETLLSTSEVPFVVEVHAHSTVLDLAIQLCYPLEDPVLPDAELAVSLLRFATAHKARRAQDFIRRHLTSFSELHPLRMFFIAAQQGWEPEARDAVLLALHTNIDGVYFPDMELVSARIYRAFLRHHHECFRTVASVTSQKTHSPVELPQNHALAKFAKGYARVAPAIYSPVVHHAVSIIQANPYQITHNFEAMRNDSERIMDAIHLALQEIKLEL